jgi:hypothetical protein
MTERRFDWRSQPDRRNANFPIRALVGDYVTRKTRTWAGPYVRLDQGAEGACVGFGWTTELMSTPVRLRPPGYDKVRSGRLEVANDWARGLYHEAQTLDEWPGEGYEGTSVLAGAKAASGRGLISEYRWAFNVDDVIDTLITKGPVVLGVPWFDGMYYTDPDGRVDVSGPLVGGHCLTATGYYTRYKGTSDVIRWRNSWGTEYGVNGDGFIAAADLQTLLDGTFQTGPGEACVAVDKR